MMWFRCVAIYKDAACVEMDAALFNVYLKVVLMLTILMWMLQLMTRKAAQMIVPNQRLQRWAFDVELVHIAQSLHVPMEEVQVIWTEIPGSKVRLTSIAHIAFELAMIKIGYGVGMWTVDGVAPTSQKPGTRGGKKKSV